jgi:ribosomal protein S18 acetylase RimI-like enzyme
MAVLQAPGREYDRIQETGLRPFDISRDLRPVAELISVAFAAELDDRGNAALREMRLMSHFGGFLGLVNRGTGEFNDLLNGFVWVEAGRVVGNVTVQRADRAGSRWQIANVAVAPSHRGRGISRRLMEAALNHAAECNGQWVVLQVYARNEVARRLYESLGFELVGGMADLRVARTPHIDHVGSLPRLAAFGPGDWQPLYELANHQLGGQMQWWRALRRDEFQQSFDQQLGEWFRRASGQEQVFRRAVQVSPRFEAAVIVNAQRWRGEHSLQLWTRPEHYGTYDSALIRWALGMLQNFPRWPVLISLSTEHTSAQELVEFYGFRPLRTLLTMRKRVDGNQA